MDKWQALCGELLTFQTSGAREQAAEARAKEAELKSELSESEKRSRELEAQAEKATKRVVNLDESLRCDHNRCVLLRQLYRVLTHVPLSQHRVKCTAARCHRYQNERSGFILKDRSILCTRRLYVQHAGLP